MSKLKVTTIHFQVQGSGTFPYDMLRFDSCFPETQVDSTKLEHYIKERRVVNMTAYCAGDARSVPTIGRWHSFNWAVVPESVRRE